jgi:hypothetical protein
MNISTKSKKYHNVGNVALYHSINFQNNILYFRLSKINKIAQKAKIKFPMYCSFIEDKS